MGRAGSDGSATGIARRSSGLSSMHWSVLEALAEHPHGAAQTHQLAKMLGQGWTNRQLGQLLPRLGALGYADKLQRSDGVPLWRLNEAGWKLLERTDEAAAAQGEIWDLATRLNWDEGQILQHLDYGQLPEEKRWETAREVAVRILRRIPEARSIPRATLDSYDKSFRSLAGYGLLERRAGHGHGRAQEHEYTLSEIGEAVKLYLYGDS